MYAGSELVIQCLARCQRPPRRASARRMASPLTSRDVSTSALAASAAEGHRLVVWPKAHGLRCRPPSSREGMESMANGLIVAAQGLGAHAGSLALCTGQQDVAAA